MATRSQEGRKQPRVRRRHDVFIEADGRTLEAQTVNVSGRGMLLTSPSILLPGTPVRGSLRLGESQVPFRANVRWSRNATRLLATDIHHSMGIEFTEPPGPPYQAYLNDAIAGIDRRGTTPSPAPPPPLRSPSRVDLGTVAGPPDLAAMGQPRSEPPVPVSNRPRTISAARVPSRSYSIIPPAPVAGPEVSTAGARAVASFGPVVGLTGRAEGSTRSSGSRATGFSALAPSSAATLIERAAVQALTGALRPGSHSVGFMLEIHLPLPPNVTLGAKLEAVARLVEVNPDLTLRFDVEVNEGTRLVAKGVHRRLIVHTPE